MSVEFYKKLTLRGWILIIYAIGAIVAAIYFWLNPIPKYEKDFINEKYHYKIVKQPGFYLLEEQPLEKIVLERRIKRRTYFERCKDIYYGVEVYPTNNFDDFVAPKNDVALLKFKDEFIEHNKELITEVRQCEIVNIKPNHKGISMSLIINDPDTGNPTYYYDTRVWVYGKMYVVHLHAGIDTTNTKENRADRDKDYGYTYNQILDSLLFEENIRNT